MATTKTVSEITRSDTWELMMDLERQVRYYGTLGDRYRLRYQVIRYLLLFGIVAEGLIVYFLAAHPPYMWALGGLVAFILGFITIFDASTNYSETSAVLRTTATDLDDLKSEAESLWRDIEAQRIGDAEAEERYRHIVDHWSRATRRITLETHDHANVKAAKEGYEAVANRYAR